MILFSILAIVLVLLLVIAVICISIGGTAFIVVFGDVIVCAAIIIFIMKRLLNKKH